jgi:hypothetical protein
MSPPTAKLAKFVHLFLRGGFGHCKDRLGECEENICDLARPHLCPPYWFPKRCKRKSSGADKIIRLGRLSARGPDSDCAAQGKRDELLESLLDIGEAAVISLAPEPKASQVLMDERKARKVARAIYGLQPIGTARILVEAKKKNLLPDIAS